MCVLITEVTTVIFQKSDSSFSLIGLPLRWFKDSVFFRILFSGMSLMYLFVCFFRSWFLFRLPFVDTYGLYYRHTDVYALAFNAEYVCRIQFSLCYHFVMLLQLNESEVGSIALSSLLGQMKTIKFLGDEFNTYMPIVLVLTSLVTLGKMLLSIKREKKLEDVREGGESEV